MGIIRAINISPKKGTVKESVPAAQLLVEYGYRDNSASL